MGRWDENGVGRGVSCSSWQNFCLWLLCDLPLGDRVFYEVQGIPPLRAGMGRWGETGYRRGCISFVVAEFLFVVVMRFTSMWSRLL